VVINPRKRNLVYYAGDTRTYEVKVAADLAGYGAKMQWRENKPDGAVLLELALGSGITITTTETLSTVAWTPSPQQLNLLLGKIVYHDLEVFIEDYKATLIHGMTYVKKGVTA
jgi:hypothetical protein